METDKHYFRVGLYVLLLSLGLAAFAVWLASDGLDDSRPYRIYFAESVSGLSEGSPVKYRGVVVGKVMGIAIDSKESRYIRVDVDVSGNAPVKVGTVAALKLQGITGTVFVELSGGDGAGQDMAEAQGRRVPIIPSEESSIATIMNMLPQITTSLSKFTEQMAKIASDENIEKLNTTLESLTAMSSDLSVIVHESRGNLIDSTSELSGTMRNLRKASRDVSRVTDRVEENPSTLIFPPAEQGIPAP
jgi:phospholipid/cholesterol/gamma-HCH transport system substrate-binding protein